MSVLHTSVFPDCIAEAPVSRRDFIRTVGVTAASVVAAPALLTTPAAAEIPKGAPETLAKRLYETLSPAQRTEVCLAVDHASRKTISANWHVTKPLIETFLNGDQQEILQGILRGATSADGYERLKHQMDDDAGGLGKFSVAFFGQPGDRAFQFMLTGRHLTLRADGAFDDGTAFGGPMVYGHGEESAPKNMFYAQTKRANEVFAALDGKQREQALRATAPRETAVLLRKADFEGVQVAELGKDQKSLVEKVMKDLLAPYRKEDVDEAMATLKAMGGLDQLRFAFYKQEDLNNDQVWDIWRLEGPGLVWHFRGAPHVHCYVNIAKA